MVLSHRLLHLRALSSPHRSSVSEVLLRHQVVSVERQEKMDNK